MKTQANLICPEYFLPDMVYNNLDERTMAYRVRSVVADYFPYIKYTVMVEGHEIRILLKDFPQRLFKHPPSEKEFDFFKSAPDQSNYLHPEYKLLREQLTELICDAFPRIEVRVYVEAIGQVVRRNLRH
jgi:hypothetical protein